MKQTAIKLWKRLIGDRSPARIFLLLLAASWISVLIAAPFTFGDSFKNLFFLDCRDAFMDFFNSSRDVAQGIGVYTERNVIYPPMANLIFLLFSKMMPTAYLNTDFEARFAWINYTSTYISVTLFLLLTAIAFYAACCSFKSKHLNMKLLAFAFLVSEVCIFGLERGNVVVLSTAATLFFLFAYDSESKLMRELALLALAFAFSIKLYPLAFAWFLLMEKRFKEFLRCGLYAVLLLILPSFFFGGPISLVWMLENTLSFMLYRAGSEPAALPWYLWTQMPGIKLGYYAVFAVAAVLFFLLCFLRKDHRKNILLLCALILGFPAFQSVYAWTLFVAPLLYLFEEKKWSGYTIAYFVLMVMPMLPIPVAIGNCALAELILPTVSLLLLLLCIVDGVRFLIRRRRDRRRSAEAAE